MLPITIEYKEIVFKVIVKKMVQSGRIQNDNSKWEIGSEKTLNWNPFWHIVVPQSSMHACLTKTRCLQKRKKKMETSLFSFSSRNFLTLMDSKLLADWYCAELLAKRICMFIHSTHLYMHYISNNFNVGMYLILQKNIVEIV